MFNESIKMALDGMLTNKLRTFLTLLGIIIGVGAVIAMVSLGFGVKEQIKSNISSLGSNLLIVMSGGAAHVCQWAKAPGLLPKMPKQ